jgi:5-methylcytosine-specific restriction endonuclease McrA
VTLCAGYVPVAEYPGNVTSPWQVPRKRWHLPPTLPAHECARYRPPVSRLQAYLRTPEWAALRETVMARAAGRCEHCGWPAVNVHHPRYPRVLGTESAASLVAVCRRCHDLNHGVLHMVRFEKGKHKAALVSGALVSDKKVGIVYDERTLYVAAEEFVKGSGLPPAILPDLRQRLENQARYQPPTQHVFLPAQRGRDELHCYSTKVWNIAVLVPITLDSQRLDVGFGALSVAYRVIADNADRLFDWFGQVYRDAFVNSLPSSAGVEMIPAPSSNVARLPVSNENAFRIFAAQILSNTDKLYEHDGAIVDLRTRVTRVEAREVLPPMLPLLNDDEFKTVIDVLPLFAIAPASVCSGDQRWDQAVGAWLKNHECERRGQVRIRESVASGRSFPAWKWRVRDIRAAVDALRALL